MPTVQGEDISLRSDRCGRLRASRRDEPRNVLVARLDELGYLFLPGLFDPVEVARARVPMVARLAAAGWLDDREPPSQLVARPGRAAGWLDGLTDGNGALRGLLYGEATLGFFSRLFGAPSRAYDFTWSRAVGDGAGTAPHCDVVFMGRGTPRVLTMWVAMCDIPVDVGGLAVLEGSHRDHPTLQAYRAMDVATHCAGDEPEPSLGRGGSIPDGGPIGLADRLDARWVFGDYAAGDAFVFGLHTVHASLDNSSGRIRLSTDSRYQPAHEAIDERWVGPSPVAHGLAAQRPRIC